MQRQTQYWVTCPACGHQMEVDNEGGPIRGKHCDKCTADFSFRNDELAVAESVEADVQHPTGTRSVHKMNGSLCGKTEERASPLYL